MTRNNSLTGPGTVERAAWDDAIQSWVLTSTLVAVFSEIAHITVGVIIRCDYFLIVLNLLLLSIAGRAKFDRWILIFTGYLVFTGVYGILFAVDTPGLFLKEIVGIVTSAVYYNCFYRSQEYSAAHIFRLYVKAAYYLCILALFLFAIICLHSGFDRLYWPMQEPAHLTAAVMPAFYYSGHRMLREKDHKKEFAILFICILLAQSSVGFIGLLLCVLFLMRRHLLLLVSAPVVAAIIFVCLYLTSAQFQQRIQDLYLLAAIGQLAVVQNMSVYVFVKCVIVAWHGFLAHPVLGNGLGSFSAVHGEFLKYVPTPPFLMDFENYNSTDANSLLLRVMAELGLVGIFVCLWFMWRFHIKGRSDYAEMSNGMLIFFLLQLLREGTYFLPPFFFFIMGYIALSRQFKREAIIRRRTVRLALL